MGAAGVAGVVAGGAGEPGVALGVAPGLLPGVDSPGLVLVLPGAGAGVGGVDGVTHGLEGVAPGVVAVPDEGALPGVGAGVAPGAAQGAGWIGGGGRVSGTVPGVALGVTHGLPPGVAGAGVVAGVLGAPGMAPAPGVCAFSGDNIAAATAAGNIHPQRRAGMAPPVSWADAGAHLPVARAESKLL